MRAGTCHADFMAQRFDLALVVCLLLPIDMLGWYAFFSVWMRASRHFVCFLFGFHAIIWELVSYAGFADKDPVFYVHAGGAGVQA